MVWSCGSYWYIQKSNMATCKWLYIFNYFHNVPLLLGDNEIYLEKKQTNGEHESNIFQNFLAFFSKVTFSSGKIHLNSKHTRRRNQLFHVFFYYLFCSNKD